MAVSVKKKIWLGTLFLFLLLLVTGGVGIFFTARLKTEGQNVLKANYETLSYCHTMQQQLHNIEAGNKQGFKSFAEALVKQGHNITEPGEAEVTADLQNDFAKLKAGDSTRQTKQAIEEHLQSILLLNMQAIQRKSKAAEETADNALAIITTLGGIVFLIALTFIVNFPSVVTNSINRLAEAIKEIANKNYSHRIHIDNKDEFGRLADAFNEMAERLQYFENSNLNKLLFEKSRAEAVINSLKDASIGIDKNDVVLFANFQALQLLGLHSDEVVGKPVVELKQKNDLFSFLVDKDTTTPFKIVVDNRENYFVKEVIEVVQGEAKNKVIVLKNITSFKELDVAKTNFISTISHELKTPLASSDFSLKLLEDERIGALTREQKELIQNIKQDNQRILKILSEILNMSQVEAGRIQLNKQKVHPSVIVDSAVETVASAAKEKEIKLIKELPESLQAINIDAEKTTWVMNNFLTNAIKYSPSGTNIEIALRRNNGSLVFSVKDEGPGIAREYQHRLFERYFQVPGSKSKGTGLGLAISKDFIEAQGGKIWVESEIGQGAKFCFELPVE